MPLHLLEYINAFYILSAKRTVGFSAENPISMMEINAFLNLNPTDDLELFMHLMHEMDNEYLVIRSKKHETTENLNA